MAGSISSRWVRALFWLGYWVLFALVIIAVIGFVWANGEGLSRALEVPKPLWFWPSVFYIGTLLTKALSFDVLANAFGTHVPLRDSIALAAVGQLANYSLPINAAVPLRSAYLHRVHGLSYTRFVPVAISAFLFSTGLYGIAAGLAALAIGPVGATSYTVVLLLFSGVGAGIVSTLLVLSWTRQTFASKALEVALGGWRRLLSSRALLTRWLLLECARAACEVWFFLSIATVLGLRVSALQAVVIVLAKECSVFLRLTPGAFGIAEGVQAFFAYAYDLDLALVLLTALIARLIELFWCGGIAALMIRKLYAQIALGAKLAT